MTTREQKPWWELPAAQPPYENALDAKREHLRSELARAWRDRREDHERRRVHGSRPPVPPPQAA